MDGEHENSPWQHKTVTFRKLLQHIVDEAGNKVFHAVNRVMLGPDAGSLQVATYRTLGVQQMAKKVKHAAVAWIYHYGTQYCKLTVKCMDKVVIGCDFDEVLRAQALSNQTLERTQGEKGRSGQSKPTTQRQDCLKAHSKSTTMMVNSSRVNHRHLSYQPGPLS